jgi:hypothetical protein
MAEDPEVIEKKKKKPQQLPPSAREGCFPFGDKETPTG